MRARSAGWTIRSSTSVPSLSWALSLQAASKGAILKSVSRRGPISSRALDAAQHQANSLRPDSAGVQGNWPSVSDAHVVERSGRSAYPVHFGESFVQSIHRKVDLRALDDTLARSGRLLEDDAIPSIIVAAEVHGANREPGLAEDQFGPVRRATHHLRHRDRHRRRCVLLSNHANAQERAFAGRLHGGAAVLGWRALRRGLHLRCMSRW